MDIGGWSNLSKLIARPPVGTLTLDYASNPVSNAAYVEISSALGYAATAVEIFNGSGSVMKLAKGAAGSEVDVPYRILPGGSSVILPLEFANNVRLSVKNAESATASVGLLVLNFFG